MTSSYPCQSHSDRDCSTPLHENITCQCVMEKRIVTGEYGPKYCKVILLTRYEMYGRHGYKPLARTSLPLHELLPSLLTSLAPQRRAIQFDGLEGLTVDVTWSARVQTQTINNPNEDCGLQQDSGLPASCLTADANRVTCSPIASTIEVTNGVTTTSSCKNLSVTASGHDSVDLEVPQQVCSQFTSDATSVSTSTPDDAAICDAGKTAVECFIFC